MNSIQSAYIEPKQGKLKSFDGLQLHYRRWHPVRQPRAIIVFVHGLAGHSGQTTYQHLIQRLVRFGYALYGIDLRGNGLSEGERNHVQRWSDYREDVRALVKLARSAEGDCPVFLLGQSLGGLIVLEYAIHHPEDLNGIVSSGPLLTVPSMSFMLRVMAAFLSRFHPTFMSQAEVDDTALSRDPEEIKKFMADTVTDPPRHTARLVMEILAAVKWTWAHAGKMKVPLLLLHGGADRIMNPQGSKDFFEKLGTPDKTIKLYPGGFHQPFIDLNREEALADVVRFVNDWSPEVSRSVPDSTNIVCQPSRKEPATSHYRKENFFCHDL